MEEEKVLLMQLLIMINITIAIIINNTMNKRKEYNKCENYCEVIPFLKTINKSVKNKKHVRSCIKIKLDLLMERPWSYISCH